VNDMGLSGESIILIIIAALVIFGPKKLPEFGKMAGSTLREFKNAVKGITVDGDYAKKKQDDR